MRGFYFTMAAAAFIAFAGAASAQERTEKLDSVVVSATRAGKNTPVTYSMISREELGSANPSKSLPEILSMQASVVTYNEGGTGLGNSAMTVRGSKGSQINVTLNGITLNDAESQEVFWVNIPSLASLISSVQLQRGLGTSANGAGAFGASVNMSTASVSGKPFAAVDVSAGSWNTYMTSVAAGTGLSRRGLYANFAWSRGTTDGYIRNAYVNSQSMFAVLGWMNERNSLRLTWLMGDQKSGITWDGIDPETYKTDRRYNGAGEYYDELGNVYYYDNQTDNYVQNHLQAGYTRVLSDRMTWVTTLNYTRGDGYDEYYKTNRKLGDFGFPKSMTGTDGETYSRSDMIYRKKMGNDMYVLSSDLRYRTDAFDITGGLSLSRYKGTHFGRMLWVKVLGEGYDYAAFNSLDSWYSNSGDKDDLSAFVRSEYRPDSGLTLFADLQLRHISYELQGRDDDYQKYGDLMDYDKDWTFFNPRAGVTWEIAENHKVYMSAALGHREPGRSDIKENIKGEISPIKPESMVDIEAGYAFGTPRLTLSANIYLMEYRDMLLETGKLSSSGYSIKENVDRSYRRGIEFAGAWRPSGVFSLQANATLSTNKIVDYTAYYEDWENGGMKAVDCGRTTMLMSPSLTAKSRMSLSPFSAGILRGLALNLDGRYVSKQYWDNTESADRCVPAYFVTDFSVSKEVAAAGGKIGITAYVNNLLGRKYYASAWVYRAWQGGDDPWYQEAGLYPQATRNFTVKISFRF